MFSIVIPTMWRCPKAFCSSLVSYCNSRFVDKVIIIDNSPASRRGLGVNLESLSPKLLILEQDKNIYVNKAWNLGVSHCSSSLIAILNDDIFVRPIVFEFLSLIDWNNIDLVGLGASIYSSALTLEHFSYVPNVHLGRQAPGFGQAMFMRRLSYAEIPDYFDVWFGDDVQAYSAQHIYTLSLNAVFLYGRSSTISSLRQGKNSNIAEVIRKDINAAIEHAPRLCKELADWLLFSNPV